MSIRTFTNWIRRQIAKRRPPAVAVVRLNGVIGPSARFGGGLNLSSIADVLHTAFELQGVKAVALSINSPGGSPVQSTLIHNRIRALAAENEVPVIAFAEDVAASGGYMLACAGDEIFADASSVVGSIGVISAGFGFPELIKNLGVERRVYTAGEHKSTLDPFQPENPDDVQRLKSLQKEVHESFTSLVKERRGDRLQKSDDELFTGEFWTGVKAVELGLADGIGDLRSEMRKRFGDKVRLRVIEEDRSWLMRWFGTQMNAVPSVRSTTWSDDLLATVETRLFWNRFGL